MNKCLIYFGDLVHSSVRRSASYFALNVAYVAAYTQKMFEGNVECKLFKHPKDLIAAIHNRTPHVLGLSNYSWNRNLNDYLLNLMKRISLETITVFGGPNYPLHAEEGIDYLSRRRCLDYYVRGDEEKAFTNILSKYFRVGYHAMKDGEPLEGCVYYDRAGESVVDGRECFVDDLCEIPSPYLSGILDGFFSSELIPLLETNRGCPYKCAYCSWKNDSNIRCYPLDRVQEEIPYIAENVKTASSLYICDSNFGIMDRDVQISEYLRQIRESLGYPKKIVVAWAKNKLDRIVTMARGISDGSSVTFSFQSMSKKVLSNVHRSKIDFAAYKYVVERLWRLGIRTHSHILKAMECHL